ncbi:hypothetical protein AMTRI_Chr09g39260 [Amborella trichopoda]|uniref:uncharacterized protein LOC18439011 n=1 Tax=Amborella trichopoda TaxID=13333 RepID=UPI0005D2E1A6|nr:uncharacterized protein LOC18439011 [Amborella trichopoda]|eukprot:XP_011625181.1 uncharacterized protein LOC18439011 [Amborella trichopoda]
MSRGVRLFDAHCHLHDPRIAHVAPQLINTATQSGVLRFAVNGVCEGDWGLVKQMGEQYPSVIPCFGLHPWYVTERTPDWLKVMKEFFSSTPSAAVGEIGLDKGSHGKTIDFQLQVQCFRQQLELAKELDRPVSIHCIRAYGDLLEIMQSIGPFPAGAILHSYLGSAEMAAGLAKLGAYFSFSGYLMSMKQQKAKKMLKAVPTERILLESDAPDGLPTLNTSSLVWVPGDPSVPQEGGSTLPKETLNHPANIRTVLNYVASLIEMPEEEVAEIGYKNAMRVFSYPASKVCE